MGENSNATTSEPLASKLIALSDLAALASVRMPREKLLALFASKLHAIFGASALAVWSYHNEDQTIALTYGHDLSEEVVKFCSKPIPVDKFPEVRLAIDGGNAWTTEDVSDAPIFSERETRELLASMNVRSVMAVPLQALTEVIGALSFYYRRRRHFSDNDKALASAFANALALSLNNLESYQRLAASERLKGEVIDIVAHQFRTPIATLRGNVELLQDEKISGDPKMRARIIRELVKVGEKLRDFVESFLNVKAIDEGRLQPKPQRANPNELVKRAIDELETYRKQHNIELIWRRLRESVQVYVDPILIGEVLLNVIGNAIKYAKRKVEITLQREGGEIVIAVKDDGVGIPVEEQPMIFQRLFRASNVARHPEASSGLGLYIAKQYVEANGGRIWFTSPGEGKGSTFYVALPVAK
jgi:signal transduction histidine kinase